MSFGIFLGENIRKYDAVRREQGVLQRLANTMLKKAFSGVSTSVRGSVIAADTLVEAILRESCIRPELYVHASNLHATIAQLDSYGLSEERRQQTRVTAIEDVATGRMPLGQLKGWFNPLPGTTATCVREGIELSQAVRQSSGGPIYPITLLAHGLSYHNLLYDYHLRILLEGTYECDSLICTSRSSRDALRKIIAHIEEEFQRSVGASVRYKGRIDVIPLCVDTARFKTHDKAHARALLRIPRDSFLVLALGRLSPLKADLVPLLPAIRSLAQRNPNRKITWIFAGTEDEGYSRILQQRARELGVADQLKFMLDITDATKALLLQAADVFTSPTDTVTESFGITVIEAMASGVPQVVPDWDGYRDTVSHGETGFLASTRWMNCCDDLNQTGPICGWLFDHFSIGQSVAIDMRQLEDHIHLLINNEPLRQAMAEQSRKRAELLYSFKPVAKQYDELWHELGGIAGSIESRQGSAQFTRSHYYHFFGHYASESLLNDTELVLTRAGEEALRAERMLPEFPGMLSGYQILDEKILRTVLQLFGSDLMSSDASDSEKNASPCWTMECLLEALSSKFASSVSSLRRHILWLLKYGFISVKDSKREA